MTSVSVRDATPADCAAIHALVLALAKYEHLADAVQSEPGDFARALEAGDASALLAECGGEAIGIALYHRSFSTFTGRPGLWLEDFFVRPEHRGRGVGRALLRALASRALAQGCARLDWAVLDWNETAQQVYRAIGAEPRPQWLMQRLQGDALSALASSS